MELRQRGCLVYQAAVCTVRRRSVEFVDLRRACFLARCGGWLCEVVEYAVRRCEFVDFYSRSLHCLAMVYAAWRAYLLVGDYRSCTMHHSRRLHCLAMVYAAWRAWLLVGGYRSCTMHQITVSCIPCQPQAMSHCDVDLSTAIRSERSTELT